MDSWLIDPVTCRRIGWKSFHKGHYESRKGMVDAATKLLLDASTASVRQPKSSSDPAIMFITLEHRVTGIYASHLRTTMEVKVVQLSSRGTKRLKGVHEEETTKTMRRAANPRPASSEGIFKLLMTPWRSSEE